MVVSGMPEATDRHAWEIAAMALDLLQVTKTFAVPHSPKEHIKLRIGIHTGTFDVFISLNISLIMAFCLFESPAIEYDTNILYFFLIAYQFVGDSIYRCSIP